MNQTKEIIIDGKKYIQFKTEGKYADWVIVDYIVYENIIKGHKWYINHTRHNRPAQVIATINHIPTYLSKEVAKYKYENNELDLFDCIIDHINKNPLDNRMINLRSLPSNAINLMNTSGENITLTPNKKAYVVNKTIAGQRFYKNFSFKKYDGKTKAYLEASKYLEEIKQKYGHKSLEDYLLKFRTIYFEKCLRDKLNFGERREVIEILNKYNIAIKS